MRRTTGRSRSRSAAAGDDPHRLGRDRRDHLVHEHVEPDGHGRRRAARAERRGARAGGRADRQDVARAGVEGRHRVPRGGRPDGAARGARVRAGGLRLHDLHRQLRPARRAGRAGDRGQRPRRRGGPVGQPQLRGPDPSAGAGQLPRLAAARRRVRARRPRRHRPDDASRSAPARTARPSSSPTSGRAPRRSARSSRDSIDPELFRRTYAVVFEGDDRWRALPIPSGDRYAWDAARRTSPSRRSSRASASRPAPCPDIDDARVLAVLGDSVTTDHISPAGSIAPSSPAGQWLQEHGVGPLEFNSYGARRGHHEVMMRGTFAQHPAAQPRSSREGGAVHGPPAGRRAAVHLRRRDALPGRGRAARRHRRARVRLRLVARLGGQGHGAARRPGGHRRELRADPPIEPRRDGRPAAPVPAGRQRRVARADGPRVVHDPRPRRRASAPRQRRDRRRRATSDGDASGGSRRSPGSTARSTSSTTEQGGILPAVLRRLADGPDRRWTPRPRRSGAGSATGLSLVRRRRVGPAAVGRPADGGRRAPSSAPRTRSAWWRSPSSPTATSCSRTCPGTGKTLLARAIARGARPPDGPRSRARPTCCRPTSPASSLFEGGGAPLRRGPRVHEHPPRRRDQPGDAADAVRAARGDAGAPGLDRGDDPPAARTRSSSSRPRTRSSSRARSRCPQAQLDRFLLRAGSAIRTRTGERRDRPPPPGDAEPLERDRARDRRRERLLALRDQVRRVRVGDEVEAYVVALVRATAEHAGHRARRRARGRRSRCTASRRRRRSSRAERSSCRTT